MNAKEQNDLTQKIWSLRNKMEDQLKKLEKIHNIPFPTKEDGIKSLYMVYHAWDSREYNELEYFIKQLRS